MIFPDLNFTGLYFNVKAILNIRKKNYGSLTPNIQKLANQISIGISVKEAFENFADDVGSKTISRAINLISQAEKAGGNDPGNQQNLVRQHTLSQLWPVSKNRRLTLSLQPHTK